MGLSSSQARLLTLSSRVHDIERKAQRIQAEKLRLANDSDRVYEEYLNALDARKVQYDTLCSDGTFDFVDATLQNLENGNLPSDVWAGEGCSKTYLLKNGATGELYLTTEAAQYYFGISESQTLEDPGSLDDWIEAHKDGIPTREVTTASTVEDKSKITSANLVSNTITPYQSGVPTPAGWSLTQSGYSLQDVTVDRAVPGANTSTDPGTLKTVAPVAGVDPSITGTYTPPVITDPPLPTLNGTGNYTLTRASTTDWGTGFQDASGNYYDKYTSTLSANDVKCLLANYMMTKKGYTEIQAFNFVNTIDNNINVSKYKNESTALDYQKFVAGDVALADMTKDQIWRRLGCMFINMNIMEAGEDARHSWRSGTTEDFVSGIENAINNNNLDRITTWVGFYTKRNVIVNESSTPSDKLSFSGGGGTGSIQTASTWDIKLHFAQLLNSELGMNLNDAVTRVDNTFSSNYYLLATEVYLYKNPAKQSEVLTAIQNSDSTKLQEYLSWFNNTYSSAAYGTPNPNTVSDMVFDEGRSAEKGKADSYTEIYNKLCYDYWNASPENRTKDTSTIQTEVRNWLNAGGFNNSVGYKKCADFINSYEQIKTALINGNSLSSVNWQVTSNWSNSDYVENTDNTVGSFAVTPGTSSGSNVIYSDSKENIASIIAMMCYSSNSNINPKTLRDNLLNSGLSNYEWQAINYAINKGYINDTIKQNLANHYTDTNLAQYFNSIYSKLQNEQGILYPNGFTNEMVGKNGTTLDITGHEASSGTPVHGEVHIPASINTIAKNFVYAYVMQHPGELDEAQQAALESSFISNYSGLSAAKLAYLNDAICKQNSATLTAIKNNNFTVRNMTDSNGNDISDTSKYTIHKDITTTPSCQYGTKPGTQGTGVYELNTDSPEYQKVVQTYWLRKSSVGEKIVVVDNGNESKYEYVRNLLTLSDTYLIEYDFSTNAKKDVSVATETKLREVHDDKELRKAEAKYEADMREIDKKDRRYDAELSRFDTERNAVKAEIESLKTIAKDNVDRTFKLFS